MLQQAKTRKWLWGFFALFTAAACHNFYKATPGRTGSYASATVDSLKQLSRYFVLRSDSEAYYMKDIVLSPDQQSLACMLDTLPPGHKLHLVKGRGKQMRYKKNKVSDSMVLNEVHLYATNLPKLTAGQTIQLPLEKVQKIEVIEKDQKRTTNSYVIGAIGYALGAAVVATVILAAIKSSCPFVSACNGERFVLQGEIYGGAIYPQLARQDYLPLKMAPTSEGLLQLKISNELKEKQYTDFANLMVVSHDADTKVLADENGTLHSVVQPQPPVSAVLNKHKNLLPALLAEGDNTLAYLDDTTTADAGNHLALTFKRQGKEHKARLVLALKNSYWLDLLYGELAKGFGSYYETYLQQQSKKPKETLQKWIEEQQLPLSISLRTKKGWKKISSLTTVGPLANRSIVVPVDLDDVDENIVELNLSSGFMFWEIDYAGLDFLPPKSFTVERLTPVRATDEGGRNVLPLLQKEDGLFLEQPHIGNVTTISYKPATFAGGAKTQTFLLHTKGWYQHVRNFSHGPDVAFLKRFLAPNAFPLYGKALYREIRSESLRLLAAK